MGSSAPDLSPKHREVAGLWDLHQKADWPEEVGSREGELMTLDTVMGGCMVFFLEENILDPPRVAILRDCLNELEDLLDDLEDETKPYFERLKSIGLLLMELGPHR